MKILMTIDTNDSTINGILSGLGKLGHSVFGWNPHTSLEDQLYGNNYNAVILHKEFVTGYIHSLCDKYKLKLFSYMSIPGVLTEVKNNDINNSYIHHEIQCGVHDNFVPRKFDTNKASDFLLISNYTVPQECVSILPNIANKFNLKIVGRNTINLPQYLGQVTTDELMDFVKSTRMLIEYDGHYYNECEFYHIPHQNYIKLPEELDTALIHGFTQSSTSQTTYKPYSEILSKIFND